MASLYDELEEVTREDMAEYVHRKWSEAKNSELRERVLSEVEESRAIYDQEPLSQAMWPDAVNLVLPFLTISVDQLEPRLVASIVGRDEIVKIDDFGVLDQNLAKDVEKVDNVVLKNDVEIVEKTKSHVHTMLVDGQVYLAPYWDYQEGKEREFVLGDRGQRVPVQGEETPPEGQVVYGGYMMQENIVTTSDRARVDEIDLENIFIPDKVYEWEDTPVVYEYYMSWGEYMSKVNGGKRGWVKYGEEELEELNDKVWQKRPEPEDGTRVEGTEEVKDEGGRERESLKSELRLLQGHFSYDIDGDGIEEKVICTVEHMSKKIVYLIDNAEIDPLNRKQIRKLSLIPRHNTGYGYPLYSKLKMIVKGGSDTTNILLNSCIMQMLPFFFYEEAAGFKQQESEIAPGEGVQVADVNRVKVNQFTPNASAFKDIVQIFFQLWQYIITLPDYSMGQDTKKDGSTATGVLALLQEAAISHDYLGAVLHDQYSSLFRIIHDLCYLNMGAEREMEILGKPMAQRVLSRNYKIRIAATSKSANRHVERMELQEALMAAEKGVQMGIVVPDEPMRDYLETFRGISVERWMNGPVSQICHRLRVSLGMDGEKQKEGEVQDPFGHMIMEMMKLPPEQLIEMVKAMQLGSGIRDEVTELVGEIPDEDAISMMGGP